MNKAGLEGVVVTKSKICKIDGKLGKLWYMGYPIEILCEHSSYEEVVYLLLEGRLPNREELDELINEIREKMKLNKNLVNLLRSLPADADAMSILRTAISYISHFDENSEAEDSLSQYHIALNLIAKSTSLITAWERIRNQEEPVAPDPTLNVAGNFLYMLRNHPPSESEIKIIDVALILHAEHGVNASTFSSRVATGTLTDMYSAVTSAIGTLKGRLHGGANTRVMENLISIGKVEGAEKFVEEIFANKGRIMGMGHRVYKTLDPRAKTFSKIAEELLGNQNKWLKIAHAIRKATQKIKPNLYPNIDFYSGAIYFHLKIPLDLYTAMFALSRMAGWAAHIIEQRKNNRLIRPLAEYAGEIDLPWIPIEERTTSQTI